MDQRDNAINELSKLMDIRVVTDSTNQTTVFTNSGIQLVGGGQASQLSFNSQGTLNARLRYRTPIRPSHGVGSLTSSCRTAPSIDMVANNVDQLRPDRRRPEAARQDAGAGADPGRSAGGDAGERRCRTSPRPARAVTGPPAGFDVELSNVLPGNTINLTYTDTATNTPHQISIVSVTIPPRCRCRIGANPQSAADRRQFLAAAWPRSCRN